MVTDDEAFIRRIVDSPGDDLPRLVYADWLDERGDPRGAYLRAEAATPGDVAKLTPLATELDPMWVGRVSRPPVGVCCDHVRFLDPGPVIALTDIEQAEQRLGGRFPTDYRAFLLNYNGGRPDPPHLPYPDSYGWDDMDLEIGEFYTASRRGEVFPDGVGELWGFEIENNRAELEELFEAGAGIGANPLIAGMAPFARTLHDLGYLLIGIGEGKLGKVYHFRDYCHGSDDPDHLADYTPTFSVFLTRLRPERGD